MGPDTRGHELGELAILSIDFFPFFFSLRFVVCCLISYTPLWPTFMWWYIVYNMFGACRPNAHINFGIIFKHLPHMHNGLWWLHLNMPLLHLIGIFSPLNNIPPLFLYRHTGGNYIRLNALNFSRTSAFFFSSSQWSCLNTWLGV